MENFEEWFLNETKENAQDTALCALTAILLKDVYPDQHEKFLIIDNIFKQDEFDNNPTLKKTREIYDLVLTRKNNIIENMMEVEKNLAIALQIIYKHKNNNKCNQSCNKKINEQTNSSKKENKLKSISKWW